MTKEKYPGKNVRRFEKRAEERRAAKPTAEEKLKAKHDMHQALKRLKDKQ